MLCGTGNEGGIAMQPVAAVVGITAIIMLVYLVWVLLRSDD